ncbi:ArsR family transcriptional regulator [Candidatus Bathyarchaeota archaeon]|nr:MAG: ArsR family transcriptional regulator [Candidatus Bathyarchaeota archaeon]
MCNNGCGNSNLKEFSQFQKYFRALHCPTRWLIIRSIGNKTKSSNEILKELKKAGESLSRSGLYYHLSELEEAGIIEMASYRKTGGGAPEKTWRLKTKEIKINLLQNKI